MNGPDRCCGRFGQRTNTVLFLPSERPQLNLYRENGLGIDQSIILLHFSSLEMVQFCLCTILNII